MVKKHDTTDITYAANAVQKLSNAKWSRTLLALPIAALGLLTWQTTAMAAAPVAAAASQTAESAGQATQQEAGKKEAQQPQGLPVEPVKAAETESAKTPSAKTVPTAAEPARVVWEDPLALVADKPEEHPAAPAAPVVPHGMARGGPKVVAVGRNVSMA